MLSFSTVVFFVNTGVFLCLRLTDILVICCQPDCDAVGRKAQYVRRDQVVQSSFGVKDDQELQRLPLENQRSLSGFRHGGRSE